MHNRPLQMDRHDLFPKLGVDQVVNSLNENAYAVGVKVPAEYVTRIVQYCENTGLKGYWNPHKECDAGIAQEEWTFPHLYTLLPANM